MEPAPPFYKVGSFLYKNTVSCFTSTPMHLQNKEASVNENKEFHVSYLEYLNVIFSMAEAILKDERGKPNHIIGVSRGGLFAAMILSEIFKRAFAVVAAKTYHYDRSQKGDAEIFFEGNIATTGAFGKFALLVDDLDETGLTLKRLRSWLMREYGYIFTNIDSAVAFKKGSKTPILFQGMDAPKIPGNEKGEYQWIIQPWEEDVINKPVLGNDPFSQMHREVLNLIKNIEESDFRPTQIIAISRDGILPALILSEYFKVRKEVYENGVRREVWGDCPMAVVTMQTYGLDMARLHDNPGANYFPNRQICKNWEGWRNEWLIVDGFARTRRTLHSTFDWLRSQYGAHQDRIRTATVYRCSPDPSVEDFHIDFVGKYCKPNANNEYPHIIKPHVWAANNFWTSHNITT